MRTKQSISTVYGEMFDKVARTHTHVSNRSKKGEHAEQKVVFKSVFDNPLQIQWWFIPLLDGVILTGGKISRPTVQMNVQNSFLAMLISVVSGVSEHFRSRVCQNRHGKRARKAETGVENHRRRKRLRESGNKEVSAGLGVKNHASDVANVAIGSNDIPISEETQEAPPILQHLTIGINEVTRRLERQVKNSRRVVTVSEGGTVSLTDRSPLIRFIFVCRADIDPPLLIGHLPHLVAACNSCPQVHSSSENPPIFIKLVPLPKGAEVKLAEVIGLRRVAMIAIDSAAPGLSTFDPLLDSVPTLAAAWLAPQVPSQQLIPTHIKQVRTSAPVDMKAAKERRMEGKRAAKQRKKISTEKMDRKPV